MTATCMTIWHWPTSRRWFDQGLRRSLHLIKEGGFSHINWNPDAGSSYLYAKSEIAYLKSLIDEAGLLVHSVHGSNGRNPVTEIGHGAIESRKDFLSAHEWQRRAGVELIENRIDLAHALGAPNVVMHVDITDDILANPADETAFFEVLFASFDVLEPYCRGRGVQIAVENLCEATPSGYCTLFDRLFDRYDADFVGLCYDSGHSQIIDKGGFTLLERFGTRLIATHLHDNGAARDDHLLPFDGTIDWQTTTHMIAATDYRTPLNLETPCDRYALPEGTYYQRAFSVARRLEEMIEGARRGGGPA